MATGLACTLTPDNLRLICSHKLYFPCAALIAGLACVPDEAAHVAVLAGDAPAGAAAVTALRQVIHH